MTGGVSKGSQAPYLVILVPIFFVFHGYYENYAFLNLKDVLGLTLFYCVASIILFFIVYIFKRNVQKAALLTAMLLMFFFFFSYVYDLFRNTQLIRPLGRYVILVPVCLVFLFLLYKIAAKTTTRLLRFSKYLNTLFLLLIILDIITIVIKENSGTSSRGVQVSKQGISYIACDTCNKPDIFFLIFDEYENPVSLKERFSFESDIDSFLIKKGFSIQENSRSNYHFTPFSIASILNMSYLSGIPDKNAVTIDDYANCNALIADAEVTRFLEGIGYQVVNYSIFDLKGNPSMITESFLPVKTKLITDRTLIARMSKDLGWMLTIRFSFLFDRYFEAFFINNNKFLQLVKDNTQKSSAQPRFIYAHFNIPHQPYFMDKNGKRRNKAEVYTAKDIVSPKSYLEYVQYADSEIKKIVIKIQQENPSAIIVLMGDHGFRLREGANIYQPFLFRNFNAVYIPASGYSSFYDSMTGVNQFRAILDDAFHQQIPMLQDTVIFLKDKKGLPSQ